MNQATTWSPGLARKRPSSAADDSPPKLLCPEARPSPQQQNAATAHGAQQGVYHPQQQTTGAHSAGGPMGYTYVQSPSVGPPSAYHQQQQQQQQNGGMQGSNNGSRLRHGLWTTPQHQLQVGSHVTPWVGQQQQQPQQQHQVQQQQAQQQRQQQPRLAPAIQSSPAWSRASPAPQGAQTQGQQQQQWPSAQQPAWGQAANQQQQQQQGMQVPLMQPQPQQQGHAQQQQQGQQHGQQESLWQQPTWEHAAVGHINHQQQQQQQQQQWVQTPPTPSQQRPVQLQQTHAPTGPCGAISMPQQQQGAWQQQQQQQQAMQGSQQQPGAPQQGVLGPGTSLQQQQQQVTLQGSGLQNGGEQQQHMVPATTPLKPPEWPPQQLMAQQQQQQQHGQSPGVRTQWPSQQLMADHHQQQQQQQGLPPGCCPPQTVQHPCTGVSQSGTASAGVTAGTHAAPAAAGAYAGIQSVPIGAGAHTGAVSAGMGSGAHVTSASGHGDGAAASAQTNCGPQPNPSSNSISFQAWAQSPQQLASPYQQQAQQQQQQQSPSVTPVWQPHPAASSFLQPPASGTSSSSSSVCWRPGIGSRVCSNWQLLSAAAAGNIVLLCEVLGEPAWHIDAEVQRLSQWLGLTFHFRLVLEQFMVLDFVSSHTLQQLPHLPPHQLTTLETWLAEDLKTYQDAAAAAAAAAGARGCSGLSNSGTSSSSSSSRSGVEATGPLTSWAQLCGGWQSADPSTWKMPPSKIIQELITEKRLVWIPLGTAAAAVAAAGVSGSCDGSQAAAAAGAAGATGYYRWQQGPADAWLSSSKATKQSKAEELQQRQHPRNQAKLLLNLDACMPNSNSSSRAGAGGVHGQGPCKGQFTSPAKHSLQQQQQQQQCVRACLDFRYHEMSHKASCHLQRHPVLAAHDRLVRVTVDRHRLCATTTSSSSSSSSAGGKGVVRVGPAARMQQQEALRRALEDVLTNGVVMAGRRYTRLVQKEVGQEGESLWLLATDSVAAEDTWPAVNPAAARQLLGGISSLPNVSKQIARSALAVSNTTPLKVAARNIIYIPDVVGPTDPQGRPLQPATSSSIGSNGPAATNSSSSIASAADAADELVMTDGSGFISQDLAELVPAVSAGELMAAMWGQGLLWPSTPLQVRLFDPHLGGVIAKGTLLPLNSSALPPGTIVLRQSQVKAPSSKRFWSAWTEHWQQLLIWAHQQHLQQQQRWPPQGVYLQQQQQQQQQQQGGGFSRLGAQTSSACSGISDNSSGSDNAGRLRVQQQQEGASGSVASAFEAAVQAAAAAARVGPMAETLRCFNAQDQPWMQQLWYIHDAMQMCSNAARAGSCIDCSSGSSVTALPPSRPGCCAQQQQQWVPVTTSSSSSSGGPGGGSCNRGCGCDAVLEVVSRPPDSSGRNPDIKVNKNLLLLLHHAGVPLEVFETWLQIEQHKLEHIDSSWFDALAAAKESGATDVVYKLEALIGVVLPKVGANGAISLPAAAAVNAASSSMDAGAVAAVTQYFKPDLALKQELHDIKIKKRQRLANLTLPVPTPTEAANAAAVGLIESSKVSCNTGAYGTRQFGIPDPTCGAVPEGFVAISPNLMSTTAQGVTECIIYRDPGIHPGDVRRVRLMPYPPELLQLIPPGLHGAIFLPSVGPSSLASSLAGGDYDGDLFLLLWEPQIMSSFRQIDPPPYIAPSKSSSSGSQGTGSGGSRVGSWASSNGAAAGAGASGSSGGGRWGISEDAGWADVERLMTQYYNYCVQVSGTMGEAHNIWELLADKYGAGHGDCQELAAIYYRALDAPKTGAEIAIPYQYQLELKGKLPPWHSRKVKEDARAAAMGNRRSDAQQSAASACRQYVSRVCRPLWSRLHDLPPLDYQDPALLETDPDLVLQEGPDALPFECMRPFLDKWRDLVDVWNGGWRKLLKQTPSGFSKASHKGLQAEKMELRNSLIAQLQQELFTGAELLQGAGDFAAAAQAAATQMMATDAAISSSTVTVWTTPVILVNASACYQAAYLHAREVQAKQNSKSVQQRASEAKKYGYEGMPRVAMPWRIAGQYLRLLKVLRPLLQQPKASRQLGSLQHPLLSAALIAQQQSAAMQRRNRGPGVGLAAVAAAVAEFQGLAL